MNKDKLLELYPNYDSVLGPYKRPDGRQHVILNNSNLSKGEKGKLKTVSFPKALKEIEIGRLLLPNETVDHDDRDFNNNDNKNLIVRDKVTHSSLDARKKFRLEVNCSQCGKLFLPTKDQERADKAGPFCSRRCSGIYGAQVQNGRERLEKSHIPFIRYRENKDLIDATDENF